MIDTTSMGIMANFVQPTSSTMASQMISKKNEDSDSSLSIEELGVSSELFSSYDLDSNGLASQSELATAIESAMSQFNGQIPSKEDFQAILSDFGFENPSKSDSNSLSSSQLETISSTLENYDANNLSKSDAQAIISAFKEAGIQPSSELETALSEAGFDAQEIGTLAGVGAAQGGTPPAGGGGGGGGAPSASSESEEEYDVMDTNEDGVVSSEELEAYYGTSDTQTTSDLSTSQQNALDILQVLMKTLKSNNEDEKIDSSNFNGLLKAINTQNNNSEINTYLDNSSASSMFDYA